MKLLQSNRGGMIFSVSVILMVSMMVIAFAMHVYPVFNDKQNLDAYANELCRVAEISGRIGSETNTKQEKLNQQMGISPSVSWNTSGEIQLNGTIEVTCALTDNIGLFGNFGSFPVTIHGHASGQSEVFWKQ